MSQCGDYEDINLYVINVFYGIVIAVYFLPFKKNHPVHSTAPPPPPPPPVNIVI